MSMGLIGRKCGMTRIFTESGESVPVSVIEITPNNVTQVKTYDNDGYHAVQVTTGTRKVSRVTKPMAGHFAKAKVTAGRGLWEFRFESTDGILSVGEQVTVSLFKVGDKVSVTGTSKGKGFGGVVKRHNFSMQRATHGNSLSHRAPGSIGQNQTPGRVFKGKKMAGQLGNVRKTVQNLEVVAVDEKKQVILLKGAIPGARGGDVIIRPCVKSVKGKNK